MKINKRILPEYAYSSKRQVDPVLGIIIHYVSAVNVDKDNWDDPETVIEMIRELNVPGSERGNVIPKSDEKRYYASYHYIIARNGDIYQLVELPNVAYHAGVSELNGHEGCNDFTIGYSLIATHGSGYTDAQYQALAQLSATHITEYSIDIDWIAGHEDVAPDRKVDPGSKFDWDRYYEMIEGTQPPNGEFT